MIPSWLNIIEENSIISFFDLDNNIVTKSKMRYRRLFSSACVSSIFQG